MWRLIDANVVFTAKLAVAIAATVVCTLYKWRSRIRDVALGTLGVLSVVLYFNCFHFHYNDPIHEWDIYHYYVGAKYLPELGYTHLYECTVIAERALDGAIDTGRSIRNLETNELETVMDFVRTPETCTSRFSPHRWSEFTHDIAFFRSQFSRHTWAYEVLHDHGFNGTPTWALFGRALASTADASRTQLGLLALIDPLLLALMWAAVVWAFGWRAACVGAIWWGTAWPIQYYWNGGAFLRFDWLATLVGGICLVKKERPLAGGIALGYSALARIFPGFVLVAIVLKQRKLAVPRILLGAALCVAVLVPAALVVNGNTIGEFVANSEKHLATPLTNHMGLRTVIAHDDDTRAAVMKDEHAVDPFGAWKQARRDTFAHRRWMFYGLVLGFLVLLGFAVRDVPDWTALVLGMGLIPIATELTCYYYGFLLLYALLERPLASIGVAAVAAGSGIVAWWTGWDDARYFDISLHVIALVIAVTALYAVRRPAR